MAWVVSSREWQAAYKRRRRAEDPEYAERSREQSREAKRRRRGVCEVCGGETRYNGQRVSGPSKVCAKCARKAEHDARRWTRETIVRAFQRFEQETGRVPRASEVQGLCESQVGRFSGRRILEMEEVRRLGLALPPPSTVRREFGSWNAAIIAAGMPVSRGGGGTHRARLYA